METTQKLNPSDLSDAEWDFLLPFSTLMREDAPQRGYPMCERFSDSLPGQDKMPVALSAA